MVDFTKFNRQKSGSVEIMNRDNNKRFTETEDKIVKAFGILAFRKPVDKITVSDVCKEANIHRTTFYGHFADIIELRTFMETVHFQASLNSFDFEPGWSLKDYILSQLNFYYSYQQLMKNNFLNSSAENRLGNILSASLSKNFEDSYKIYYKITDQKEMLYHQTYLAAGAVAVIKKWVLSGCRETPAEMADIICNIIEK